MQVSLAIERLLAREVRDAFAAVRVPDAQDILAAGYASIDGDEMSAAWAGKHWSELTTRDVFIHRESIFALSGVGFRAYVAAFLVEGLPDGTRYRPDIRGYLVASLRSMEQEERGKRQQERLSLLDGMQRAATIAVLRHFVYRFRDDDALAVLRSGLLPGRD